MITQQTTTIDLFRKVMIYQFFFLSIVTALKYAYTFTFLYDKEIEFIENDNVQDIIAKVTFQQSTHMADAYTTITEAARTINKKYKLNKNTISLKGNAVTQLLYDMGTYANRIKTYNSRYTKILNEASTDPLIPPTKEIMITIDETFTTQIFDDISKTVDEIVKIFNLYPSDVELVKNTEHYAAFANLAEILTSCTKDYMSALETHVTSAKLAYQSTASTQLENHLILDEEQKIDFKSIDFISFAKTNNDLIYYIEYSQQSSDIKTHELVPIAYYGYSLEDNYYFDVKTATIKKTTDYR